MKNHSPKADSAVSRSGARRSNRDRTEATRDALLQAARALFVGKGYADTVTPQVVELAGVTRGALYHHFEDKRDLFRAVLEKEAHAVAQEIEAAAKPGDSALAALRDGSDAYLAAMQVSGRTRLLLIDGPAALGSREAAALDDAHAARTLREGLAAALEAGGRATALPVDALADLLSAAFDRAALAIEAGADAQAYRQALKHLIDRVVAPDDEAAAAPARKRRTAAS